MLDRLDRLQEEALAALQTAESEVILRAWKSEYLTKSSTLLQILGGLGNLPKEDRPAVGHLLIGTLPGRVLLEELL